MSRLISSEKRSRVTAPIGLAPACAAALLLVAAVGCKKPPQAAVSQDRPPTPVEVSYSIAEDVPVYIDQIGKVAAFENVTIMPQVTGQVSSLHFTDGADVKKGALLVTIDDRPFKAVAAQAMAQLQRDQATAENARRFAEREAELFRQKSISAQENDQAQFAAKAAVAAVSADRAAIDAANLNVEYCQITAPIDGRVGQHQVDPGNIVKANEGSLVVVQKMDPVYVDFVINEKQLNDVRTNMAKGTLKTYARIPSESGEGREGSLTFLDNSVQDGSGTVKLRATIPNKDRHFWPGQFVWVRLVLSTKKDAILVPEAATQVAQGGTFVFVVKGDTAEQRKVTPGQKQGDMVVIEDGLKAKEAIVTDGQYNLFPGAKVSVKNKEAISPDQEESDTDSAQASAAKGGKS